MTSFSKLRHKFDLVPEASEKMLIVSVGFVSFFFFLFRPMAEPTWDQIDSSLDSSSSFSGESTSRFSIPGFFDT